MRNENNASAFQKELKSLRVMHLGLMAGLAIVLLNMLFLNNFQLKPALDTLVLVALFLAVAAPLAVQAFVLPQLLAAAKSKTGLQQKWNAYRTYAIMSYAILEGPALVNVVVYFLTQSYYCLIAALLLLVLLVRLAPNREKVISDLELLPDEAAQF